MRKGASLLLAGVSIFLRLMMKNDAIEAES